MIQKTEAEIMQNWKDDISSPMISICSITYNHESFIEEALDSFLMQETDFPFEIVIDDDCSPDGTADIIRQYKEKFPNIINDNLMKKNIGAINNFIANMQRANGKYIALCEGDDYWTDPLKLQKQVDFLENHSEYVITYHDTKTIDEKGSFIEDYPSGAKRDLESYELKIGTPISTLTVCFRNVITTYPNEKKFSKIGDLFLWAILAEYGKGKYIKDIKPAVYRVHNGGIYSKIKQDERLYMRFTLNSALLAYHHRIGNKKEELYFKKLIFKSFIVTFDSSFILRSTFNILKQKAIHKLYRVYKFMKTYINLGDK